MSVSTPLAHIPCLNTDIPYHSEGMELNPYFDLKTKICLIASAFFAVAGLILLALFPPIGGICISVALCGICLISIFKIVELIKLIIKYLSDREIPIKSKLDEILELPASKELEGDITISPELEELLQNVMPIIDSKQPDSRIDIIEYPDDKTGVFVLKAEPSLQFRFASDPLHYQYHLVRLYGNMVYAKYICNEETYDLLLVPLVKPIYLEFGGLKRMLLVEKRVQKVDITDTDLAPAISQMVRFLLKTGGNGLNFNPLPFIPVTGNKLALQNLLHLSFEPRSGDKRREENEVNFIIADKNSLLASLDKESLIDIALEELKKLRPTSALHATSSDPEFGSKKRLEMIDEAKKARMIQINKLSEPLSEQTTA